MSDITSSGYLAKDPNMSMSDANSINNLYNSWSKSDSADSQGSIEELMGSSDQLDRDLGKALDSGTYSAQAVHDMIWAIDNNPSSLTNPADSLLQAASSTQNDKNPNITASDKQFLQSWANAFEDQTTSDNQDPNTETPNHYTGNPEGRYSPDGGGQPSLTSLLHQLESLIGTGDDDPNCEQRRQTGRDPGATSFEGILAMLEEGESNPGGDNGDSMGNSYMGGSYSGFPGNEDTRATTSGFPGNEDTRATTQSNPYLNNNDDGYDGDDGDDGY